jgi:hypothetical protein
MRNISLSKLFKIFFIIFVSSYSFHSFSQLAIGGGFNSVVAFGVKKPYPGLHLFGEMREDDQSYYVKISSTLKQASLQGTIDLEPIIDTLELGSTIADLTFKYTNIEVGKRYYFGQDIDYGFSAFGGSHVSMIFNKASISPRDFNKSLYQTPVSESGSILGLAVGLNGGVQQAYYFGTIYLDAGLNYLITAIPSNQLASDCISTYGLVKSVSFTFNIGYKRSIIW